MRNRLIVSRFNEDFKKIKEKTNIFEEDYQRFKIIATKAPYKNVSEMKEGANVTGSFKETFDKYYLKDTFKYIKQLKEDGVTIDKLCKTIIDIKYKVINQNGSEISGGEKAEFNLLKELEDAKNYDILLLDEPESSFDNPYIKENINTLIKEGRNRMSGLEKKFATKSKIVNYIINRESTSKVEISKELNLSMPTVLSNVKDLLEKGIIIETGEYESTGGRKAKSIGINPSYRYAMGIVITANHLGMVLVNLKYEIVKSERIRLKFVSDMSYCSQVADFAAKFLDHMDDAEQKEKLLGVGISIPGIINQEQKLVIKSHALKLENYSLSFLEQAFSVPVYFSNDANAAMMAEDMNIYQNAIYLSLNQTLGGAFCIGGNLFSGENQKAGEFGHMILVPQGRKCYCGKSGCADAYCAAGALVGESKDSVEQFMQLLQNNDEKAEKKWEEYLDYLAVLISNLRMAYDMDIILGGEMGGYLSDYMIPLGEKVMKYNGFDHDLRYLKNCSYKKEASAVGAAKHFLQDFIGKI